MDGGVCFYGLTSTSMKLKVHDRHLRLIDIYKKLHAARAKAAVCGE
jgi:ribosomal protein S12 methylthiotransferase accessory factor